GHDMVVFHERDIRKRLHDFAFLNNPPEAAQFLGDVNTLVQAAPFTLVAAVIHKTRLKAQYAYPDNPYDMALTFCLERAYGFLHGLSHVAATAHVIVESRGRVEDNKLELSFLRTCAGNNYWKCALPFQVRFCSK